MRRGYPNIDMVETGRNLKQIMLMNGLAVKDIQSFLGLSAPQSIYHWLEGKSLPTLDNIYALSELFQMPVDSMLIGNRKYVCTSFLNPTSRRLCEYYVRLRRIA